MKDRVTIGFLVPLTVALLVMLPRLGSPQFGLLDDGLMVQTGREVVGRWSNVLHLIPETGRFFPAYWLAYATVFGIADARPLAFFTVNALLLAGLLAMLARLVKLSGGTPLQGGIAVVLFAVCGPTIETFYTLSKAESLQMTWIGVSLLLTAAAAPETRSVRQAALIATAGIALLFAYATKETSIVLIPVSLGWLAIEWRSPSKRMPGTRFVVIYLTINLVAAAAFTALRWYYAPLGLAEGSYTRAYVLHPGTIVAALFRISAWLIRDFAFLLPLLAVAAFSWFRSGPESRRPLLYAAIWMAGWLAVYLPWPATFEYHLFPFAFGASVLAGTVIGNCRAVARSPHSAPRRRLAWSVLVPTALLWLVSTANAVADARVQLMVDHANAELVEFLARLPNKSRIVLNTRLNEYVVELPRHLSEIKGRPDLVVDHVAGGLIAAGASADVFVATPQLATKPAPTVRVPFDEAGARHDQATLAALLAGRSDLVYRGVQDTPLIQLGMHTLLCYATPVQITDTGYCPSDRRLIDRRPFSYGWQVHRLGPSPGRPGGAAK
jgi:hypothetical protein